jgi:hypothetical protein
MSSAVSAEQLGHLTMFVEDEDGLLARLQAMLDDKAAQLPGLCVHFAPMRLDGVAVAAGLVTGGPVNGDAVTGERPGEGAHWPADHPLGIVGQPAIKIASPDPKADCAELAARAGRPEYEAERSQLNAVGYGVRLDDCTVEFVGSATGSAQDLVGGFLTEHGGRGIFATTYQVRDLSAARAALAAAGARFTQWGRHSLLLRIESGQSTAGRIELTDEE